MSHPARFSKEVIDVMVEILQGYCDMQGGETSYGRITIRQHLHDPFAGTGERLWELAQRLSPEAWISGTEIEPEFIVNPWIKVGDATDPTTYPCDYPSRYIIVTSPSYPNGMADSWAAQDASKRKTYRAALREITGVDRELHVNNQGRYGYRGTRSGSAKRIAYWRIAEEAVNNWGGASMCLVNVSDFIHSRGGIDIVERVTSAWQDLLERNGWDCYSVPVGTKRMGYGANRNKRVDVERIIVGKRATNL